MSFSRTLYLLFSIGSSKEMLSDDPKASTQTNKKEALLKLGILLDISHPSFIIFVEK